MDNNKELINAVKLLAAAVTKETDELKNLTRMIKDNNDNLNKLKDKIGSVLNYMQQSTPTTNAK